MRNIKRVDAANNNVSTVSGLSNSRNLKWLDLSNNPFRNLDFLKDSNCIRVLILKNVRVPNLSVLSYLKHTIVLNLSENSLYNDPLICLQNMIILKSLSLSDNMYTEFPDISNTLLFELNLERNKFTSLSFPHLLPSLKILRLEGNRIEKMSNFSMCPNLSELYLFGNNITGILMVI